MSQGLDEIRDHKGKLPSFAWPGGYPMFYVTNGGLTVCPTCANATTSDPVTAYDVNWENPALVCDDCGERIESAYAEDKATNPLLELEQGPGKYEGEIKLTRELWESDTQDDQASFDDGAGCYALYLSLDQDKELGELGDIRAAILYESSDGFVGADYYESNAEAQAVWDTEVIPEVYPEEEKEETLPDYLLELSVCTDCLMAIANDDYTGMDDAREKEVRSGIARQKGHLMAGDSEKDNEFSWKWCDVCGTTLGGARHQAFLDTRNTDVDDGDYIAERIAERDDIPPTPFE